MKRAGVSIAAQEQSLQIGIGSSFLAFSAVCKKRYQEVVFDGNSFKREVNSD